MISVPNPLNTDRAYYNWLDIIWVSTSEVREEDMLLEVIQSVNCVQLFVIPWTAAGQASLSFIISWSLLKLMLIELVMPSNNLILCCPFLLLLSIFSSIRVFSNESLLIISYLKYWSFSFSISPSNEHSGEFPLGLTSLITLQSKGLSRIFHNTTVQKHQFFRCSAFFMVQLLYLYMTTGKILALTRWTFVGKIMPLLFNMLSRFIITSSKEQASFEFVAADTTCSDIGAQENKFCHCLHCLPSICHEVMALDALIFVF